MLRSFYSKCVVLFGAGAHHHLLQPTLQSLRCTSAAGLSLMQVRGAKRKFGGIHVDPFNLRRRNHRIEQFKKSQKKPLMSEERLKKKIDLPYNVTSLNQVIATVLPLEAYAKAPLYTRLGLRQRLAATKENAFVIHAGGVIKRRLKKVDPFVTIEFARKAQEQFIEANMALLRRDKRELRKLMTENAASNLRRQYQKSTYKWEFQRELERPRIVSARVAPFNTKDNLFAQVVVRLKYLQLFTEHSHSGKLLKGDPDAPSDVIRYVVFERHLVNPQNTSWRIMAVLPNQRPWREIQEKQEEAREKENPNLTPTLNI